MSARSLNKVQLIGNLTRDPELRYTPQGTAVCTFGVATNRSWTPTDGGERQEETEFHRVVAWSKLAEICSQLLYKGRRVYLEGRLQTRSWQGQDGQERTTTEIVIDNMIALGAPKGGTGEEYEYEAPQAASAAGRPQAPASEEVAAEEPEAPAEEGTSEAKEEKGAAETSSSVPASKKGGKKTPKQPADEDVADDIPF
ncbi:MAG: single-stranded DNA-binding protein [Candidatus Chisholmbacteria bacterium]|nr:single-stranded DNA-binding protein [Candidatus Chisholmbacteria bacterium]